LPSELHVTENEFPAELLEPCAHGNSEAGKITPTL
jgi:hypothetical protein